MRVPLESHLSEEERGEGKEISPPRCRPSDLHRSEKKGNFQETRPVAAVVNCSSPLEKEEEEGLVVGRFGADYQRAKVKPLDSPSSSSIL